MSKNRFRICRDQRGYKQEEVATAIGVTRAAYSHYENGRRDMPLDVLLKLADFYDCTTDELLGSSYWYANAVNSQS